MKELHGKGIRPKSDFTFGNLLAFEASYEKALSGLRKFDDVELFPERRESVAEIISIHPN